MTEETDIWRAAHLLVKRHGDDAEIAAAQRADECIAEGDLDGQMIWKRILAAVRELQRTKPAVGERGDEDVKLSPKEYELLRMLVLNAGKVLTHRQILNEVWGPAHVEDAQYLRVFVRNLRQKLESDPARPALILTEPGVGYRLQSPL